jgi:DNA-binding NarL/FixJ family response regulator
MADLKPQKPAAMEKNNREMIIPPPPAAVARESTGIDPSSCRIVIAGQQEMFNQLLAQHIIDNTGIACQCTSTHDVQQARRPAAPSGPTLVMIDANNSHPQRLMALLHGGSDPNDPTPLYFCLFNVCQTTDAHIEKEAIHSGLRGIFYQNDPPAILFKGVKAILAGELWYSRDSLIRCLVDQRSAVQPPPQNGVVLTHREKEILLMIASGLTNDEIAQNLNLSAHTIKTHAYNIYRKINVPNRIQASLWAARYLQE